MTESASPGAMSPWYGWAAGLLPLTYARASSYVNPMDAPTTRAATMALLDIPE